MLYNLDFARYRQSFYQINDLAHHLRKLEAVVSNRKMPTIGYYDDLSF